MSSKRTVLFVLKCGAVFFIAYTASYLWFRHAHSYTSWGSTAPITEISTTSSDAALLTFFHPALWLDAKFGPSRVYIRTDASGEAINYYKRYPFCEFVPQSNVSMKATQ